MPPVPPEWPRPLAAGAGRVAGNPSASVASFCTAEVPKGGEPSFSPRKAASVASFCSGRFSSGRSSSISPSITPRSASRADTSSGSSTAGSTRRADEPTGARPGSSSTSCSIASDPFHEGPAVSGSLCIRQLPCRRPHTLKPTKAAFGGCLLEPYPNTLYRSILFPKDLSKKRAWKSERGKQVQSRPQSALYSLPSPRFFGRSPVLTLVAPEGGDERRRGVGRKSSGSRDVDG